MMGVYQIKNIINNKIYIGSTENINIRFNKHLSDLRNSKHHSIHLQRAWNKYGERNFKFNVLKILENKEELLKIEQIYLDTLKSWDTSIGYNIAKYVDAPMRNRKHTKETKEKIGKLSRGRVCSQETIRKRAIKISGCNNYLFGKHPTEDAIKHMSESHRGYKMPEEQKRKIGLSNPNHKTFSLEEKKEMIILYLSGKTTTEIGTLYDCAKEIIKRVLIEQNIHIRSISESKQLRKKLCQ